MPGISIEVSNFIIAAWMKINTRYAKGKAIEATGLAYAESKSELRNVIDAIRPIALYAAIAAAVYYIFKK